MDSEGRRVWATRLEFQYPRELWRGPALVQLGLELLPCTLKDFQSILCCVPSKPKYR